MVWQVAIPAAASIFGGFMGSSASKKAAAQQAQSAAAATAEERRQFDLNRQDLAPYRQVGKDSLMTLAQLLGLPSGATGGVSLTAPDKNNFYSNVQTGTKQTGGYFDPYIGWKGRTATPVMERRFDEGGYNNALASYDAARKAQADATSDPAFGSLLDKFTGEDLENEPGYQFAQSQGELALQRGASRNGMRLSPATMKALLRFNNDYGSTKFNDAFTRDMQNKQNTFNMLSGVAGTGQSATTAGAQLGSASAGNIGNYLTQAGNAAASGTVGSANAIASGLSGAGNAVQNQYWLNQFLNQPKTTPTSTSFGSGTQWGRDIGL